MAHHISELVKAGDVDVIVAWAAQHTPDAPRKWANAEAGQHEVDNDSVSVLEEQNIKTTTDEGSANATTAASATSAISAATDSEGRTAVHWAFAMRQYDLAKTLMAPPHDATVSTKDDDGTTPLMTAVAVSAPFELLNDILSKTSPEMLQSFDAAGNSALILAASRGNQPAVRMLLHAGANFRHVNHRKQTALHRAVSRGSTEAVEEMVLFAKKAYTSAPPAAAADDTTTTTTLTPEQHAMLEYKRFVNSPDDRGNTPLHYASMENNQEIGQLLLRNGADRNKCNKDGKQFWEM